MGKVIYEAREHHVSPLVYSALKKSDAEKAISPEVLKEWKKEVFHFGINRQGHIQYEGTL